MGRRIHIRRWQENLIVIFVFLCIAAAVGYFIVRDAMTAGLCIVEVHCDGSRRITEDGEAVSGEYIKIRNTGLLPVRTGGLWLSDDGSDLAKAGLEDVRIEPGSTVLFPFDKDRYFSLKNTDLYLSDRYSHILSHWDTAKRMTDVPVFSVSPGIYRDEFELGISAPRGCRIYYTLDGSEPDESSALYEAPVRVYDRSSEPNLYRSLQNVVGEWKDYEPDMTPVDKAFIIRAVAVGKDGVPSEITTGTYFVGDRPWDRGAEDLISLVADPDDLFGEDGIYVTGKKYDEWYTGGGTEEVSGEESEESGDDEHEGSDFSGGSEAGSGSSDEGTPDRNFEMKGRDWEIRADMTMLRKGSVVDEEPVGLRISGRYNRSFPEKRMSVYARDEYGGSDYLDVPLFGGEYPVHSVVFRAGRSDADVFFAELAEDRSPITMATETAAVYVNGEYWYTTYMREKFSGDYFEQHFDIDKGNIFAVKNGWEDIGDERDYPLFLSIYEYLEDHDLSDPAAYEEFGKIIDIPSYIECQCVNVYAENMDYDEKNNTYMWRAKHPENKAGADGKWRWALYDLDSIEWNQGSADQFGVEDAIEINVFNTVPASWAEPLNERPIFKALKANDEFRRQFVTTFMDMINGDYSEKNVSRVLQRYGHDLSWNDDFFRKRADYVIPQLAEEFDLQGEPARVHIHVDDPEGGKVRINSITADTSDGEWTGRYFSEYPAELTAVPEAGYYFAGWSQDNGAPALNDGNEGAADSMIKVDVRPEGVSITASFKRKDG